MGWDEGAWLPDLGLQFKDLGKTPVAMKSKHQKAFRILRFYSVASLISILFAALLLAWVYRYVALSGIVDYGERNNLLLSHSLLNAVRPELTVYLMREELHHGPPIPDTLGATIHRLMENTGVVMVDILDDEGIVVHSTDKEMIGRTLRGTQGYQTALKGAVHSRMALAGETSVLGKKDWGRVLIDSYIPISAGAGTPIEGVFVVESDVTPLMADIELTQYQVFFASMAIMLLLYMVLLGIVRYAERIIRNQETQLRERSRALELLSSQLISAQENEKYRLSQELHEGIAQTLASVKMRLEHADSLLTQRPQESEQGLGAVVALVKEVIKEVRSLAMGIRPPSLDELGLLDTLRWYGREMQALYPQLKLTLDSAIAEEAIPASLKVVIFRSIQQALEFLALQARPLEIELRLSRTATGELRLELLDDLPLAQLTGARRAERERHRVTLHEFIGLSGGESGISAPNACGGSTLWAEWPL